LIDADTIASVLVKLRIAPSIAKVARHVGVHAYVLEESLLAMAKAGLIEFWDRDGSIRVLPSPLLVERLKIEIDEKSRRWVAVGTQWRPPRQKTQKRMIQMGARRPESFEQSGELSHPADVPHPVLILVGCRAWPLEGQSRAPDGPELSPEDDPRGQARLYVGPCACCGGKKLDARREYCTVCDRPGAGGKQVKTPGRERGGELKGGRGA
jgi:hypothetical protein